MARRHHPSYAALLGQGGVLDHFFDGAGIGLNLCTLDGEWLESNPAFLRLLGFEPEDTAGQQLTHLKVTPRKYDADDAEQHQRLISTGRMGPYEKELIRKDGSLVPVRVNGFIVEAPGERLLWSFIEDISGERALQTERLRAIHASKLSALGEMAASVAHEINNPLAIISAWAFSLPETIAAGDEALFAEAIADIRRAVERAGAITSGLRKLSRGTNSSIFDRIEVRSVIDEAAALAGARTRLEGLQLGLDIRTRAWVLGNAVQLTQVLLNLINNAVDAVKRAPVRHVALRAEDQPASVLLTVEDTGPGIPAEHRERLFDRFFTTKHADEGTGLGLAISKDIVASMGGSLSWERVEDRTRFIVAIPTAPPPQAPEGRA